MNFSRRSLPFLLLLITASFAATDTITLETLTVQGQRPTDPSASVTAAQVAVQKPMDLAEVLARELPAVSLVRKGPLAGDFLLRGLGRDNVRLSLDGMTVHGACPNRMDPPAFHVSSQQIERVAVRRGPFDLEDGGTIGGVVRLGTPACCDTPEALSLFAGSFGYHAASASERTFVADTTLSASIAWQQGDVYRDGSGQRFTELPGLNYRPAEYDRRAFAVIQSEAKLATDLGGAGLLDLRGGYHRATDVLYPGLRMDARLDESWRTGATWALLPPNLPAVKKLTVEATASGVFHDMRDNFRTSSAAPVWSARGWMMRTLAWTQSVKLKAVAEAISGKWTFRYGAGADERTWKADNVVMTKTNAMLPDVVADTVGAFALGSLDHETWGVELAARLDTAHSRARGDLAFVQAAQGTTANARTDTLPSAYVLAHRSAGPVRFYAGLGHAARAPDPQERYQNLDHPTGGDWVGDPRLSPVQTTEGQAGVAATVGHWTVRASAFHAWLSDYIYLARLTPAAGSTANPANTKTYLGIDARLGGGDLAVTWHPAPAWTFDLGLATQRGVKRDLAPGNSSRVLGEIPEVQIRAAAQWTGANWSARLQWQGAPRQTRVDPGLGETSVAGWGTLATSVGWRLRKEFEIAVGVENLLDRTYTLHNAYTRDPFAAGVVVPEPGRFVYVRLAWRR
jgi:iron complex outermembrane recepter protein